MRPTLFSLEVAGRSLALPSYGLLVAAGFTVGIVLIWREGKRQGMDGGRLLDLCFWGLVLGLAASRLAYVALNAGAFAAACFGGDELAAAAGGRLSGCTAALRFWEGGLVFYGGAIGAGAVVVAFCRRERWSFWRVGDLLAPSLAIGHALGRLGCLAAGCCFGRACAAPWGVTFGPGSVAFDELRAAGAIHAHAGAGGGVVGAPLRTLPLHPTQLYEAAAELVLFAGLLALRRRSQALRLAPGALLLDYVGAYAAVRFVIESFRGDLARRFLVTWPPPPAEPLFLSTSQVASLAMMALVATAVWRRRHGDRAAG